MCTTNQIEYYTSDGVKWKYTWDISDWGLQPQKKYSHAMQLQRFDKTL